MKIFLLVHYCFNWPSRERYWLVPQNWSVTGHRIAHASQRNTLSSDNNSKTLWHPPSCWSVIVLPFWRFPGYKVTIWCHFKKGCWVCWGGRVKLSFPLFKDWRSINSCYARTTGLENSRNGSLALVHFQNLYSFPDLGNPVRFHCIFKFFFWFFCFVFYNFSFLLIQEEHSCGSLAIAT